MIRDKFLVIGHRGSGKSSFLHRVSHLFEHAIDLDREIEKRSSKSILEIFSKYGEDAFRKLEVATLDQVIKELGTSANSVLIVLGAGYSGSIWPREYKCLWIRRETDLKPRFFKDRPVVATSDPEKFLESYIQRESRYQQWADFAWTLTEELKVGDQPPLSILDWPLKVKMDDDACLTLVPRLHRDLFRSIELRKEMNLLFELRSDFWNEDQIKSVLEKSDQRFLVSVRSPKFSYEKIGLGLKTKNFLLDWDVGLDVLPEHVQPDICSQHDFSQGLKRGLDQLVALGKKYPKALLKASPIVSNYSELSELWKWKLVDSERRMIYPRSKATEEFPLWQWFRLYLKGQQKINFVREATEGLKDQPTLLQYKKFHASKKIAAVMGFPIVHSVSPEFHFDFFARKNISFLAIPLTRETLSQESFKFLDELGLVAAAVTSPLKESKVFDGFRDSRSEAEPGKSNTLIKIEGGWKAFNTDSVAIEKLFQGSEKSWRIWGSGAMAQQCFDTLKNCELYSSRDAKLLKSKGVLHPSSFNLLWAAGDEASLPPDFWKPNEVYDLSYTMNSHAILYASKCKVDYINGVKFFEIQANAQQGIWKSLEEI